MAVETLNSEGAERDQACPQCGERPCFPTCPVAVLHDVERLLGELLRVDVSSAPRLTDDLADEARSIRWRSRVARASMRTPPKAAT